MRLKPGEETVFTSKRGKVYRVFQKNGKIMAKADGKMVTPTKEILRNFVAELPHYTVYTDGGCAENPGGVGGYGVVIIDDAGEIREYSGGFEKTTNNRMEIFAVLRALQVLGDCEITLVSDSEYVLKTIDGIYHGTKNNDLWEKIAKARKGKKITTKWVRGHSGDAFNERCDTLATQAMLKISPAALKKGGAMAVITDLPESDHSSETDPDKYMKDYSVNRICAENIITFYKRGLRNFKAYAALKTGGSDSWSAWKIDELKSLFGKTADRISEYTVDPRTTESALRWLARGLSSEDAVRKALVDKEIGEKIDKKFR